MWLKHEAAISLCRAIAWGMFLGGVPAAGVPASLQLQTSDGDPVWG